MNSLMSKDVTELPGFNTNLVTGEKLRMIRLPLKNRKPLCCFEPEIQKSLLRYTTEVAPQN